MARKLKGHDPKKAAPSKPKILVYGKPGVGKTWGALGFPGVYYIDTEGGADLSHYTDKLKASGGTYLGPRDGANDVDVVCEEIITLATVPHKFGTLVIDSYSKLYNTAIQIEYDRIKDSGEDMGKTFGREKKPAIGASRKMIRWFEKLDMNVILICHEKDVWKDSKVVGESFDGWERLEYELHLVLQVYRQGKSHLARVCKNRLAQFTTGDTFDWCYEEFGNRYGMEVMEATAKTVEPATAEQVEALNGLLTVVKVDDGKIQKWFEKAGVDRFSDMTSDTIQACINYLKKQLP